MKITWKSWAVAILPLILSIPLASQVARKAAAPHRKLQALSQDQINYIRPGVVVKIVSAAVAKDGTVYTLSRVQRGGGEVTDLIAINTSATA